MSTGSCEPVMNGPSKMTMDPTAVVLDVSADPTAAATIAASEMKIDIMESFSQESPRQEEDIRDPASDNDDNDNHDFHIDDNDDDSNHDSSIEMEPLKDHSEFDHASASAAAGVSDDDKNMTIGGGSKSSSFDTNEDSMDSFSQKPLSLLSMTSSSSAAAVSSGNSYSSGEEEGGSSRNGNSNSRRRPRSSIMVNGLDRMLSFRRMSAEREPSMDDLPIDAIVPEQPKSIWQVEEPTELRRKLSLQRNEDSLLGDEEVVERMRARNSFQGTNDIANASTAAATTTATASDASGIGLGFGFSSTMLGNSGLTTAATTSATTRNGAESESSLSMLGTPAAAVGRPRRISSMTEAFKKNLSITNLIEREPSVDFDELLIDDSMDDLDNPQQLKNEECQDNGNGSDNDNNDNGNVWKTAAGSEEPAVAVVVAAEPKRTLSLQRNEGSLVGGDEEVVERMRARMSLQGSDLTTQSTNILGSPAGRSRRISTMTEAFKKNLSSTNLIEREPSFDFDDMLLDGLDDDKDGDSTNDDNNVDPDIENKSEKMDDIEQGNTSHDDNTSNISHGLLDLCENSSNDDDDNDKNDDETDKERIDEASIRSSFMRNSFAGMALPALNETEDQDEEHLLEQEDDDERMDETENENEASLKFGDALPESWQYRSEQQNTDGSSQLELSSSALARLSRHSMRVSTRAANRARFRHSLAVDSPASSEVSPATAAAIATQFANRQSSRTGSRNEKRRISAMSPGSIEAMKPGAFSVSTRSIESESNNNNNSSSIINNSNSNITNNNETDQQGSMEFSSNPGSSDSIQLNRAPRRSLMAPQDAKPSRTMSARLPGAVSVRGGRLARHKGLSLADVHEPPTPDLETGAQETTPRTMPGVQPSQRMDWREKLRIMEEEDQQVEEEEQHSSSSSSGELESSTQDVFSRRISSLTPPGGSASIRVNSIGPTTIRNALLCPSALNEEDEELSSSQRHQHESAIMTDQLPDSDIDGLKSSRKTSAGSSMCKLIAAVLFVVGTIVIIVIVTKSKKSPEADRSQVDDGGQMTAPPTIKEEYMDAISYFQIVSSETTLQSTDSPQYAAMQWIVDADTSTSPITPEMESDDRIFNRYILAVLYYTLGGDQWAFNEGWLDANLEVCDWQFINCVEEIDAAAAAVPTIIYSIDMDPANNAQGELPSELYHIPGLEQLSFPDNLISGMNGNLGANIVLLNLSGNLLAGGIPEALYEMTSLIALNLESNSLSGSISSNLENLSNLEYLDMHNSGIEGSLEGKMPTSLKQLDLSYTSLSGSFHNIFTNHSNLAKVSFKETKIDGSIPFHISDLSNLEMFDISRTDIEGGIPDSFWSLEKLNFLDIGMTQLSGTLSTEVGNLSLLESFKLESSLISGSIPSEIGMLTKLTSFEADTSIDLTGTLPSEFGELEALKFLDLAFTSLTGTIPLEISRLANLEKLSIRHTYIHGTVPMGVCELPVLQAICVAQLNALSCDCGDICKAGGTC